VSGIDVERLAKAIHLVRTLYPEHEPDDAEATFVEAHRVAEEYDRLPAIVGARITVTRNDDGTFDVRQEYDA
jgi:hypothetical protein